MSCSVGGVTISFGPDGEPILEGESERSVRLAEVFLAACRAVVSGSPSADKLPALWEEWADPALATPLAWHHPDNYGWPSEQSVAETYEYVAEFGDADDIESLLRSKFVDWLDARIWERLLSNASAGARAQVAGRSNAPVWIQDALATDRSTAVRTALAEVASDPVALELLAQDGNSAVREALLRNDHTTAAALDLLAARRAGDDAGEILAHPNAPLSLAVELASADATARATIAYRWRDRLPADTADLLTRDADWDTARAAWEIPTVPEDRLREGAADDDYKVRRVVARNPSCPSDLLDKLAHDRLASVRHAVAANPSTPEPLLERLATGKEAAHVARNPSAPAEILDRLAADHPREVASNSAAPAALQEKLAADAENHESLARNPSCPAHLVEYLCDASLSDRVSRFALEHPNCPDHVVRAALSPGGVPRWQREEIWGALLVQGRQEDFADLTSRVATGDEVVDARYVPLPPGFDPLAIAVDVPPRSIADDACSGETHDAVEADFGFERFAEMSIDLVHYVNRPSDSALTVDLPGDWIPTTRLSDSLFEAARLCHGRMEVAAIRLDGEVDDAESFALLVAACGEARRAILERDLESYVWRMRRVLHLPGHIHNFRYWSPEPYLPPISSALTEPPEDLPVSKANWIEHAAVLDGLCPKGLRQESYIETLLLLVTKFGVTDPSPAEVVFAGASRPWHSCSTVAEVAAVSLMPEDEVAAGARLLADRSLAEWPPSPELAVRSVQISVLRDELRPHGVTARSKEQLVERARSTMSEADIVDVIERCGGRFDEPMLCAPLLEADGAGERADRVVRALDSVQRARKRWVPDGLRSTLDAELLEWFDGRADVDESDPRLDMLVVEPRFDAVDCGDDSEFHLKVGDSGRKVSSPEELGEVLRAVENSGEPVVVERVGFNEVFAQAMCVGEYGWAVEYRAGSAENHFASQVGDRASVLAFFLAWVHDEASLYDDFLMTRLDL